MSDYDFFPNPTPAEAELLDALHAHFEHLGRSYPSLARTSSAKDLLILLVSAVAHAEVADVVAADLRTRSIP